MAKKLNNFIHKTKQRQNFKLKNELRLQQGLPIIIKSKNKGNKTRLKVLEQRKLRGLPCGPQFPPGQKYIYRNKLPSSQDQDPASLPQS